MVLFEKGRANSDQPNQFFKMITLDILREVHFFKIALKDCKYPEQLKGRHGTRLSK